MEDPKARKRMRVPTSCAVCRKRKIKCDKLKPSCSGCVKSGVGQLCHYEKPQWVNSKDLWKNAKPMNPLDVGELVEQTADDLQARVRHLEASLAVHDLSTSGTPLMEHTLCDGQDVGANGVESGTGSVTGFLTDGCAVATATGPTVPKMYDFDTQAPVTFGDDLPFVVKKSRLAFQGGSSLFSLMKMEPHLQIVWSNLWEVLLVAMDGGKVSKMDAIRSIVPDSYEKSVNQIFEMKRQHNLLKDEDEKLLGSSKDLDEVILHFIPPTNVIMRLFIRYFKVVYPFVPFIQEQNFLVEIERIFGPIDFKDSKPTSINTEGKYSYATIGLVFLMMRFAYLSIEKDEFEKKPELGPIRDVQITEACAGIALQCLEKYKYMNKSYSVRVIQLMLMLKVYSNFSPQLDDVARQYQTQNMFGVLFTAARGLGLHADPTKLLEMFPTQRGDSQGPLWRRLWHSILELDSTYAVMMGFQPLCHDEDSYTTEVPTVLSHMDDMDKNITLEYRFINAKTKLLRKISQGCYKVKRPPTALQVMHYIHDLETLMSGHLGSLKSILQDHALPSYAKVKKVINILDLSTVLTHLQIIMLGHFDKMDDTTMTFKMFDSILSLSMRLTNSCWNLFYNMKTYFGPGFSFVIRPPALGALKITFLFITTIAAKLVQCKQLVPPNDTIRWNLLNNFFNASLLNMHALLRMIYGISSDCNQSLKLVFVCRLIYEQLRNPTLLSESGKGEQLSQGAKRDLFMKQEFLFPHLSKADMPKTNCIMRFLDSELEYLTVKSKSDPFEVLRPLNRDVSTATGTSSATTGSSGQFYDPIDGFRKQTPASSAGPEILTDAFSATFGQESPEFDRFMDTPMSDLSTSVTSEEYASLFGVFDDYNVLKTGDGGFFDAI